MHIQPSPHSLHSFIKLIKTSNMNLKSITLFFFCFCISNFCDAQDIRMYNGIFAIKYKKDGERLSKKKVATLMSEFPRAEELWEKSNKNAKISLVTVGAAIAFWAWQVRNYKQGKSHNFVPVIGALSLGGTSFGFSIARNRLRKEAILEYNLQKYSQVN